jgi:hypothetical protein
MGSFSATCRRELMLEKGRYQELIAITNAREKPIYSKTLLESVERTWADGTGYIVVPDICGHPCRSSVADQQPYWEDWRKEQEQEEAESGEAVEGTYRMCVCNSHALPYATL